MTHRVISVNGVIVVHQAEESFLEAQFFQNNKDQSKEAAAWPP